MAIAFDLPCYIASGTPVAELKVLCKERGWTVCDAKMFDNEALRHGIGNGHLESVKWLTRQFDLTIEDVRAKSCTVLQIGITYDQWESVGWLIWYFGLEEDLNELEINDTERKQVEEELAKLRPRLTKAAVPDHD